MMIENLEASMLRQLCVVCQDHQIKRYKECKDYTQVYEMHTKLVLITLKDDVDKELCWEENNKTDHKEEGCVAVSWINLAHYCNKWRILLNVLMDIQAP